MTEVIYSGPFFATDADRLLSDLLTDINRKVSEKGVTAVKERLRGVLKNPTGRYENSIQTERQQNDMLITDGKIVYGPWLEGEGSRNQTTRFKGYHTFRIVTQQLDGQAITLAQSEVSKFVSRMN